MVDRKLKLLIVSDYFYPHWTGIAKSVYYLIQAIKEEFDLTILTVRFDKHLKKEENLFSSKILREDYLFSLSRAKVSVNAVLRFIRIVRNYDIVFINSPCTNIIFFSVITRIFNKKLLIFHQGDLVLPKGIVNKLIEKVFDIASYMSLMLADKVSTYTQDYAKNSRVLKPFLKKCYPFIIPIYFQKSSKNTLQKKINKKNRIFFGFAGRFVEEKGFDILFDAIPEIIKKIPNAHFLFAGETNMQYEDFFQKSMQKYEKVKNHITILGLLNDNEIVQFYKKIDFIIIPSRSDCFNLVQAEAMLFGVPSIVSDIPGVRYLVRETGFGVIFEKEDAHLLALAVSEAVRKKDNLRKSYKQVKYLLLQDKLSRDIKKFFMN